MERKARRVAEIDGTDYTPVTQRGAQVHGVRQQRSLMADLLERMVQTRDIYTAAREADVSRLSAATEVARALFSGTGARDFAASFSRAYQGKEAERQRVFSGECTMARNGTVIFYTFHAPSTPGPQRPRKAGKGRGSSRRRRLLFPWARRLFHLRKMCSSPGTGERYNLDAGQIV